MRPAASHTNRAVSSHHAVGHDFDAAMVELSNARNPVASGKKCMESIMTS
jgi:hypothetical protein